MGQKSKGENLLKTGARSLSKEGSKAKELEKELKVYEKDYLPTDDCKITLYDGRTGEPVSWKKVTIGQHVCI